MNSATLVGRAWARAGLLGNPSDGYGGKTIACTLDLWSAEVRIRPAEAIRFVPGDDESRVYPSIAGFRRRIEHEGYYGGLRILQAAAKRFFDYCDGHSPLPPRNFEIEYATTIPRQLGLGGSSALVVATLRALAAFYGVKLPLEWMPSIALSAEVDELNIPAGLQDRVVQSYEGLVAMDFSPQAEVREGEWVRGRYERLDPHLLPPIYVAISRQQSEPTEVVHGDLRRRFAAGDPLVLQSMQRLAELADAGRRALHRGEVAELARLIDENFEIRRRICPILPRYQQMIDVARGLGFSASFCGSGGAIVGLLAGGPPPAQLAEAMRGIACELFQPGIGFSDSSRGAAGAV